MSYITDWEFLLGGYNDMFKTSFLTVNKMLKALWEKEGRSIPRSAEVLGVSPKTLTKKMQEFMYVPPSRYVRRVYGKVSRKFLDISVERMEKMTSKEIAEAVGCDQKWVSCLSWQYQRKRLSVTGKLLVPTGLDGRGYAAPQIAVREV